MFTPFKRSRRALLALLVCALAATAIPATAQASLSAPSVMTRNLYLGADLTPGIGAALSGDINLVLAANAGIFAGVQATDFPARANALAAEVDADDPWLIGLQEVALWRSGPIGNPAAATTVEYDFLTTLLARLSARGLHYAVVAQQQEADLESPAGAPYFKDFRLTMRDVILARTDIPRFLFKVSNPQSGNYATNLSFPTAFGPINVLRGWTSVDVKVLGRPVARFANTHLEAFNDLIKQAQAAELVATPAVATSLPVILVGDLNSDPAGAEPGAYNIVTGAGLADTGNTQNTCCHAANLLNPVAAFTERIDHILTRPNVSWLVNTHVIGTDPAKRVPSGAGLLWPSDHGGLVAGL